MIHNNDKHNKNITSKFYTTYSTCPIFQKENFENVKVDFGKVKVVPKVPNLGKV